MRVYIPMDLWNVLDILYKGINCSRVLDCLPRKNRCTPLNKIDAGHNGRCSRDSDGPMISKIMHYVELGINIRVFSVREPNNR